MTSTLIKIGIGITIFTILIIFIPFSIGLPNEIYEVLTNGFISQIFQNVSWLFPVNFALKCILIVFLSHYVGIFWNIIKWVKGMVFE